MQAYTWFKHYSSAKSHCCFQRFVISGQDLCNVSEELRMSVVIWLEMILWAQWSIPLSFTGWVFHHLYY